MHRWLFLFTILLLCTVEGIAQFTIDYSDIESRVNVSIESYSWDANDNISGSSMPDTTGLEAILRDGDADFRSIVKELKKNAEFRMLRTPTDVPGADSFALATHVEQIDIIATDSTLYQFFTLDDNALTYHGTSGLFSLPGSANQTVVTRYEPEGWILRDLPVRVGDAWQTSFTQATWLTLPQVGMVRTEGSSEKREYEMLRTTTLITPNGTVEGIVAHIFEHITLAQGAGEIHIERYSFITKTGLEVTVGFEIDKETHQWLRLNDIAYFVPKSSSSVTGSSTDASQDVASIGEVIPIPVRTTASIPLTLHKAGSIRLSLYDLAGQEVLVLYDGTKLAGVHQIEMNVGELTSGVYSCRLEFDSDVFNRMIIVQK